MVWFAAGLNSLKFDFNFHLILGFGDRKFRKTSKSFSLIGLYWRRFEIETFLNSDSEDSPNFLIQKISSLWLRISDLEFRIKTIERLSKMSTPILKTPMQFIQDRNFAWQSIFDSLPSLARENNPKSFLDNRISYWSTRKLVKQFDQ